MKPPVAKKIPHPIEKHGHVRTDNYYWMKERENPDVIDYIKKENAYTQYIMKDTQKLQDELYREIIGRIKQTDRSVPYKDNGYYYYIRYEEGNEYPIYCRRKENMDNPEEILIDVNVLAKGYSYYHVSGITVSEDNKIIAFGEDTLGRRLYTLRFINLVTGEFLPDKIMGTNGKATWAKDNKTVFYIKKDFKTLRSYKVFKHILGMDIQQDNLAFHEKDETYSSFVYKSKSRDYIFIVSSSTLSDEYRYIKTDKPAQKFEVFHPREKELEYNLEHYKEKFIIRTNYKARNFRLMETSILHTQKDHWKELIPHREHTLLENFEVFETYLVLDERKRGITHLRVINTVDKSEHYMDFNEQAYMAWISVNMDFDSHCLRFGYNSLTTPTSTYVYNMETRERILLKQQEILGSFNPDEYQSERLFAIASDGADIPISLVYKKDTPIDGSVPLLLYGYGSYGHTIDPYFSSPRLSILNRGFIFAIAHVRGGEMLGRKWYEEGKLLKKKNTFDDFIACAEYLVKHKYTNKDRLFAMGGSAGGLLMGVIANMNPPLFKGIIASVPFVDVITTMLDDSIPLTTGEYDEWGNPHIKEFYQYMLSYSPYDNIKMQNYPHMLITSGLHDSQVQYWEPTKWVTKLREHKTDDNMLLLYTQIEAGHSGASGRFEQHKETALEYAFLLKICEI